VALLRACCYGRGGVVRALLESGTDPTFATNNGTTPTAIAKHHHCRREPPGVRGGAGGKVLTSPVLHFSLRRPQVRSLVAQWAA
jgi:hypothetical protein